MNRKKIKIYERSAENDIRYRGPLSYRHLMVIGWICVSFEVLTILLSLQINIDPNQPRWVFTLFGIFGKIGEFALPLFLLSNFAVILDKKFSYKTQLLKFGSLSFLIVLLFFIVKDHFITGIITAALRDRAAANALVDQALLNAAMNGTLAFNLFIDLFLCTLFLFFLNYEPKKYFQGRKKLLFRLFSLLPILYELGALAIRICMVFAIIQPPDFIYPFLTTKPLMSFFLFVFLILGMKILEYRFRKNGKTTEDLDRYTQTNFHSLRFSIFASIMILITGIVDQVLYVIGVVVLAEIPNYTTFVEVTEKMVSANQDPVLRAVNAWGLGNHATMVWLIPVVLLFSYTRNHKNQKADLFIPAGGILLAFIVGIEGLYQGIVMNLPILIESIQNLAHSTGLN